jgi:hypothetical protein
VDLHEQRQLEVARQMAKVKARARPWRAIFALVLAAAAGIISSAAGRDFESWTGHDHGASKIVAASTAAAFCLLATVGILGLAGVTSSLSPPEPAHDVNRRERPSRGSGGRPGRSYTCVDSYLVTTSEGMRPRSLTANPFAFAQARTCALCLRCAAVLRFARTGRADALRACDV